jgi:hypothetical protein
MRWSDADISFGPEDHPDTELSNRNLPFIVKIPIGRHKVAKTLIDCGASLNLMMRKTFIEMGLNLVELTPMHDIFDHPRAIVHPHRTRRPGGVLWVTRKQAQGDADI